VKRIIRKWWDYFFYRQKANYIAFPSDTGVVSHNELTGDHFVFGIVYDQRGDGLFVRWWKSFTCFLRGDFEQSNV